MWNHVGNQRKRIHENQELMQSIPRFYKQHREDSEGGSCHSLLMSSRLKLSKFQSKIIQIMKKSKSVSQINYVKVNLTKCFGVFQKQTKPLGVRFENGFSCRCHKGCRKTYGGVQWPVGTCFSLWIFRNFRVALLCSKYVWLFVFIHCRSNIPICGFAASVSILYPLKAPENPNGQRVSYY